MKKFISVITAAVLSIGALAVAAPAQAVEDGVTVIAQVRSLAGQPYLAVRVDNDSDQWLRARLEAPVVTDVRTVDPGKSTQWTVKLRDQLEGTAEVSVQQLVDGRLVKETFEIEYDAS